mmetsp:Transcript_493/g.1024  ORF Transcript_493/g.1024 Transcript_493/m.1024 type:complete len:228 (+) Transcript_493:563-1246(+)
MPIKIADWFDRVGLSIDLHLIRFDGFLDCSPNLRQPGVDASLFDAGVRAILCGRDQVVILRVERNCESAVDNPSIHLNSKIQLTHIVMCQHYLIPIIRGVVRSHMIQGAAGGKSPATIQPVFLNEFQSLGLKPLANVNHCHPRANVRLGKTSYLPVAFCRTTDILVVTFHNLFRSCLLCISLAIRITPHILLLFTLRKIPVGIELCDRNCRRAGLLARQLRPISDSS